MNRQNEYVLRTIEERNVRFVHLWFTDVLGTAKAFTITPAELSVALDEGMSFDGSAIDGFSRDQENEMLARPDATTFQILPWPEADSLAARMFCDITNLDGTPFEGDPRQVLRRAMDRAKDSGYSFLAAPEVEFFYFEPPSGHGELPTPIDSGSYFDLEIRNRGGELRRRTVLALEEMGIPVQYSQHEDAPGQHEIDLRYTDALSMADTVMTTRLVVKKIAAAHGAHATFMPKPISGIQGSGMHTHFSLFRDDENVFHDDDDLLCLSPTAKAFMAGVLRHAAEMTAVTNQWVNSYKRLVPGFEAPVQIGWAHNNGAMLLNVPGSRRPESTRIEFRSIDPAVNPYLAFASVLWAGLDGIEKGYELPDASQADAPSLPSSLHSAIGEMKQSKLMLDVLGEHVFDWFIRNKQAEWRAFETQVGHYERSSYLQRL